MFELAKSQFNPHPHITLPINDQLVLETSMIYFDKEGYELNLLEQLYYRANTVHIGRTLYHTCCQQDWYVSNPEPKQGPYFDHCMILTRWDYQDAAKEQLGKLSRKRPSLNKLLKIKPKWGIDLAMEYQWPDGDVTEIFHIEMDRHSVDDILEWKHRVENIIENNDWHDVAKGMLSRKSEWEHMNSDEQSDWRCHYIGLPRAYDNYKVL